MALILLIKLYSLINYIHVVDADTNGHVIYQTLGPLVFWCSLMEM